jgi:hypothetical protein
MPGANVPATTGPPGRPRPVGMTILLTIVTCGIWSLVWSYQNGEELKNHNRTGIGGVGYLVITLLFSPATVFLITNEVEKMYERDGTEPPIRTLYGLWILLPIVGAIIWYVKLQNALNDYWTSHGSTELPHI